jgi:hypothetical protein
MMYFIQNILRILFTIYDVLNSKYMMYFIHNIVYFIHNIVNKIHHKCCSVFVALLCILNYSINYCNNLFSCSPAVSLQAKTDRCENLIDAVFRIFLSNIL